MTADEFYELLKILTVLFGIGTILLVYISIAYEKTEE